LLMLYTLAEIEPSTTKIEKGDIKCIDIRSGFPAYRIATHHVLYGDSSPTNIF
jgi:hypothetical protein